MIESSGAMKYVKIYEIWNDIQMLHQNGNMLKVSVTVYINWVENSAHEKKSMKSVGLHKVTMKIVNLKLSHVAVQ